MVFRTVLRISKAENILQKTETIILNVNEAHTQNAKYPTQCTEIISNEFRFHWLQASRFEPMNEIILTYSIAFNKGKHWIDPTFQGTVTT